MHTHTFFVQCSRAEGCGLKILKIPVESTRFILSFRATRKDPHLLSSATSSTSHTLCSSHAMSFFIGEARCLFLSLRSPPLCHSFIYLLSFLFFFFPLFSFLMNINSISSTGKFLPFFQRILATPIASRKKIVARAKFVCMVTRCVFTP